jgi:Holliday junction resolvase RusA-like endonuclease
MTRLEFFVEGHPQTAGSKTAIPNPKDPQRPFVVESGDRTAKKTWREDVRAAARQAAFGLPEWRLEGPFAVEFVFHRLRPKSHYGSGRNADLVKASAPAYPVTRPDALKLARAVEDALTAILWHDDAAIVDERLRKVWGQREGVSVEVRRLGQEAAPLPLRADLTEPLA